MNFNVNEEEIKFILFTHTNTHCVTIFCVKINSYIWDIDGSLMTVVVVEEEEAQQRNFLLFRAFPNLKCTHTYIYRNKKGKIYGIFGKFQKNNQKMKRKI